MRALAVALGLTSLVAAARADVPCRAVEISFQPVANLQIAVWIEDDQGRFVDTAYVSRSTGVLGLGNRPGAARLKTDFRWPYGRREMVLPVWAHRRNHSYGYVVMGGRWGNSIMSCAINGIDGSECDDATIGSHFDVSSNEPFYCSPRGGVSTSVDGMDVVSCASPFYGSKGAYADPPAFSLYPPRADLVSFDDSHDGDDAHQYAQANDLVAVSGATPVGGALIEPIRWQPPHDGNYVAYVEASLESDFNLYHHHPNQADEHPALDGYGHEFLGQPAIVYAVPFTVGDNDVEALGDWTGYADWDGATGTLHGPDLTISTSDGSGADRLQLVTDDAGSWRVRVRALSSCGVSPNCVAPAPPATLALTPAPATLGLRFAAADGNAARFDVRYRQGQPITDGNFLTAVPSSAPPPPPGAAGALLTTSITGLEPDTHYWVAVRSIAGCGAASPIAVADAQTPPARFVTLSGCFIATAAYGTPLAAELAPLRRFRDRVLLATPAGQLAVAIYYALSPPLARALSADDHLRAGARSLLQPVVRALRAARF